MKIKYSKVALRYLCRQDRKTVERIRAAINGLTLIPPQGDIKPLKGFNDKRKRLRIGSVRVIYKITDDDSIEVLFVIDINNRGDIYK